MCFSFSKSHLPFILSIFAKHFNSLIWSTSPLSQSNSQFNNYFKSPWILQQNNYIIIHNHYTSSSHLEKHDWQIKIQYFVTATFNACYACSKAYLTNWLLWQWRDYLKSEIQMTEISAILGEVFRHCKVLCLYSTLPAYTETNQSHNFHLIKPGLESKVQSSLDNASL
jgi:hypothetical protein